MLARRNWCEVLPFVEEQGAAVDPRSHNALASSQPLILMQYFNLVPAVLCNEQHQSAPPALPLRGHACAECGEALS